MLSKLRSFFADWLKPVDLNLAHFTCPRCAAALSDPFNPDAPYPVYCPACDKTFMAESELVESHPITWEDRLTGESYLGRPRIS